MENELKAVDGEILWDMEFGAQLFLHQGAVAPGCVYPGRRIEDRQVVDGTGLGRYGGKGRTCLGHGNHPRNNSVSVSGGQSPACAAQALLYFRRSNGNCIP